MREISRPLPSPVSCKEVKQKVLKRICPIAIALVLVVSVVLGGAVTASAAIISPTDEKIKGEVPWDYYTTDKTVDGSTAYYTVYPEIYAVGSWFELDWFDYSSRKTIESNTLCRFGSDYYLQVSSTADARDWYTLKYFPFGGRDMRTFLVDGLQDGDVMTVYNQLNVSVPCFGSETWTDVYIIWYEDDNQTVIQKDYVGAHYGSITDSFSVEFELNIPEGAYSFLYYFQTYEFQQTSDDITDLIQMEVDSYFTVKTTEPYDYRDYIISTTDNGNQTIFNCDIPDTTAYWALNEYYDGKQSAYDNETTNQYYVDYKLASDGYSYKLSVFPTGGIGDLYSVSAIPYGSTFSAFLSIYREGIRQICGKTYFYVLYYDSDKQWISEQRVTISAEDVGGDHVGSVTFKPPEDACYFLYKFVFDGISQIEDGEGTKNYYRVDTSFSVTVPESVVPSPNKVLSYSDYIIDSVIDSGNNTVYVSFPTSQIAPSWTLYDNKLRDRLGSFSGASGSFSEPLNSSSTFPNKYMVVYDPFGGGYALNIKNIPDSTTLNLRFAFSITGAFETPTFVWCVSWYDSAGNVILVDTSTRGSVGDMDDDFDGIYVAETGYVLSKPAGAVAAGISFRLCNYAPVNDGASPVFSAEDFSFSFSVPTAYVEQEKTDAINGKLDNIITGGSAGESLGNASDSLKEDVGKLDQTMDDYNSAMDGLPGVSGSLSDAISQDDLNAGIEQLVVLFDWETLGLVAMFPPLALSVSLSVLFYVLFGRRR